MVPQSNGTSIVSTHTCKLPLASLSPTARRGYIIPALTSYVLLSLGQLCDDNYHVILHKYTIIIYKGDKIILEGDYDFTTEMWIVTIPHSPISPLPLSTATSTTTSHPSHLLLHTIVIAYTNRKQSKMWPDFFTLLVSHPSHKHSSKLSTPDFSHHGLTSSLVLLPSTSPNVKQLLLTTSAKPRRIFAAHKCTLKPP